jgi:hypothetical protein
MFGPGKAGSAAVSGAFFFSNVRVPKNGERNPDLLCERALNEIRQPHMRSTGHAASLTVKDDHLRPYSSA